MSPDFRNRSASEILSKHIYHDALGFGFRAASWLDYAERTGDAAALFYACIDGRLSIEHLIFELIVSCSEPRLTKEDYQRCLNSPRKIDKLIAQVIPNYEKLVVFSQIVQKMNPDVPNVNFWDIKNLMKNWGHLSNYLHWSGAAMETTENAKWQSNAFDHVELVIFPYWNKLNSGHSGSISVESMSEHTKYVWEQFRNGEIDSDSAHFRLEMLGP